MKRLPWFTSGGLGVSPPHGLGLAGPGPVCAGTEPAAPSVPAQPIVSPWRGALLGLHTPVALVSLYGRPILRAASREPWTCTEQYVLGIPTHISCLKCRELRIMHVKHVHRSCTFAQQSGCVVRSNYLCEFSMSSISCLCRCWTFSSNIWLWSRSSCRVFTWTITHTGGSSCAGTV